MKARGVKVQSVAWHILIQIKLLCKEARSNGLTYNEVTQQMEVLMRQRYF